MLGQAIQHRLDHITKRSNRGRHIAFDRLVRQTNFDDCRFDGATASVMMIVFGLAELAAAGFASDSSVRWVFSIHIFADYQSLTLNQFQKRILVIRA